jgi:hypothetical protein
MKIKAQKFTEALSKPLDSFNKLSDSAQQRVASVVADKYLSKLGISQTVNKENVAKSATNIEKLLSSKDERVYHDLNANVTKGMLKEIATLRRSEMSSEQIYNFYWSIPEFVSCWHKLGFDSDYLNVLIADTSS